ncbi:hypothetical protein AQUCO_01800007v1 [Aquilegia coerulea]|uniref:Uncharacterized protein n=1 Tax=Aquilegia coerulea TaxID=218851 RepID=A0A2G5DJE3_AQUCA|nr:hypothetical protein AQUCO_01800007v1 [Aquilegia coerulea]
MISNCPCFFHFKINSTNEYSTCQHTRSISSVGCKASGIAHTATYHILVGEDIKLKYVSFTRARGVL